MLFRCSNSRRTGRRPLVILLAIICLLFVKYLGTPVVIKDALDGVRVRVQEARTGHSRSRLDDSKVRGSVTKSQSEHLEAHIYRPDGLLEVNPNGPHPIFELTRRGQEAWERKLEKASKTFDEAVEEYQRRYNRMPPRGFGDWWAYVERHSVQLPDEYDQIFRDLEPFWGMDPIDLQQIQREWEAHVDSFTIGKDELEEPISIKNYTLPHNDLTPTGHAKGAYEIMELLEEVQNSIPPFRAVFSPHDNPNLHTDYQSKQEALVAARLGTFIDVKTSPEVEYHGWISACSPGSPARTQHINWDGPPPPIPHDVKTFIYNHRNTMDPCLHPSHLLLHGQYISHRVGPVPERTLVPQFSYSPTILHHDITPAMPINWIEDIFPREDDPEWDERWDERLQWRGSNTGMWHGEDTRWDLSQRTRLVCWAGDGEINGPEGLGGNITVLMPIDEGERVGNGVTVKMASWAPAMVDIAFAGQPIHCAPEICRKLRQTFEFRKRQEGGRTGKYKYYIDVDGNGWSSRFKRLITSNAVVFKSTIYPEWYIDRVAPWVHYVPVQVDLSDLWDTLVFFRGDPAGNGGHDDMAKRIAQAGRAWSRTFWRKEDMVAYMFRLFLEYSRVMDPQRNSLSHDTDPGLVKRKPEGLGGRLGGLSK